MYIENVNDLTRDIFQEQDIYDEIMAIDDGLRRAVVVNEVTAKAKDLGVKTMFENTLKEAKKEYARREKLEIASTNRYTGANVTDFTIDGVVVALNCGEWVADDDSVRIHTDKGLIIVCPHPIYISKILKNAETGQYKVELIYKIRGRVSRVYVPRETIASSSKIIQLSNSGIHVIDKTAPMLVQYLSDLEAMNLIDEGVSTSRLGWVMGQDDAGKKVKQFLPYQSNVTFDNEVFVKSLFESIRPTGSRDKWYKLIKDIRAKRQPEVLINLAASFASVLVEPCGTLPFIVSLWGGTGIGKSVILKICTSIWADPGEGKYITDAKATYTAMEMRLNVLNSLPMTLDDMAQVKNQYDGDFSELIYRWCAGKGKDRSNKELGLNKLTSWRNCTITNGERSLVDEGTQGGAINRVIDIEASGEVLFSAKEGNKTVKTVESNYGFAGMEFIDQVCQMGDEQISQLYNEFYEQIKKIAADEGVEKEEKQIVPMALILTADYLSEKWLFGDEIRIDIKQAITYLRNKGDVSEESRAYEYLMDTIAANQFRFEDNPETNTEQWGLFQEDNKVAIIGTVFERIIKQGGFQGKAFLSWAKRKDLIECDNNGTPKKVIKFYGKTARAVVLRTDYQCEDAAIEPIDPVIKALPFV